MSSIAKITKDGMDDQIIIESNIRGSLSKRWVYRWYVLAFCYLPALFLNGVALLGSGTASVALGQLALSASTFLALYILSNRPLINPIQSVVFCFHWWFAVGPASIALFAWFGSDYEKVHYFVSTGGEALWIVAGGLPLYAIASHYLINKWPKTKWQARFLLPEGSLYRIKTIVVFFVVGGFTYVVIGVLSGFSLDAYVEANYLGGRTADTWWLAAFSQIGQLVTYGMVGSLAYLFVSSARKRVGLKILILLLVMFIILNALSSGWKGALMLPLLLLVLLNLTWNQRLPWVAIMIGSLFFFGFVEPFVHQSRMQAESHGISTSEERRELFHNQLGEVSVVNTVRAGLDRGVNIESPFRGIYVYASEISTRSSLIEGPWEGHSIVQGFHALVPRFISPQKPDLNVGNFFGRELGATEGYVHSIAITIPFEFVGNYGYLVGVLSFAVLGCFWTALNCWLLTVPRLATHPLAPLLVMKALSIEAPVAHFLAGFRDMPIPLFAALCIWLVLQKRV